MPATPLTTAPHEQPLPAFARPRPVCSHCHTPTPGFDRVGAMRRWMHRNGWIRSTGGRYVCAACIGPRTPIEDTLCECSRPDDGCCAAVDGPAR